MDLRKWLASVVLAAGMLIGGLSQAQNAGTPSFGAQKSFGIDTIDLVSLTPEIKLPIYFKPGPLGIHPTFQIQPQCKLIAAGTDGDQVGVLCNSLGSTWVNDDIYAFYASVTTQGDCTYFYNFKVGSVDGLYLATHPFYGAHAVFNNSACGATTETIVASDDSGIQVYLSASYSTGLLSFTVYDSSGRIYNNGALSGGNGGVEPTSFQDAYGNTQSWGTNGYTDEYGINSPTSSGSSLLWLDANSNTQQLTFTTGPQTSVATDFTGSCVEVQWSGAMSPLTSLTFPDGSTFALSWEQGPSSGTITGRINGYTRREGGVVSYVYGNPICNASGSGKTISGNLIPSTLTRACFKNTSGA